MCSEPVEGKGDLPTSVVVEMDYRSRGCGELSIFNRWLGGP